MSNIVFILGAGASKQCGAPLMTNFLDVAAELLRTNKVQEKRAEFEQVFKTIGELQVVHSKAQLDLNNIESIFTVLELGRIIQRIPGLKPEEITLTIAALKDLIVKTLEVTMLFPVRERQYIDVPKPYDTFAELLLHLKQKSSPPHSVSVISFNYDIAVDLAMFRNNLGPDYILDKPQNHNDTMPLMKLHGSLNWATVASTKQIKPLHLVDYLSHYSASFGSKGVFVPIGSQLVDYFRRHASTEV